MSVIPGPAFSSLECCVQGYTQDESLWSCNNLMSLVNYDFQFCPYFAQPNKLSVVHPSCPDRHILVHEEQQTICFCQQWECTKSRQHQHLTSHWLAVMSASTCISWMSQHDWRVCGVWFIGRVDCLSRDFQREASGFVAPQGAIAWAWRGTTELNGQNENTMHERKFHDTSLTLVIGKGIMFSFLVQETNSCAVQFTP